MTAKNQPGRFEVVGSVEFPPRPDGGGRTWELPLPLRGVGPTAAYVMGVRAAGTISGRHYHRGLSASKRPEVFLLMSGKAVWRTAELYPTLTALDPDQRLAALEQPLDPRTVDAVTGEILEYPVEGPCAIVIWPGVWHELLATTDVQFLELNSIADHAADTWTDWQPGPLPTA